MIYSQLGRAKIEISELEQKALAVLHHVAPAETRDSNDLEAAFFADLIPIYIKARQTFGDDKTLDILTQASEIAFLDLHKKGANHEQ